MKPVEMDVWESIIFTDESKYNLFEADGNYRVWRFSGNPTLDHHFRHTVKFGGGSVMVWGAITSQGVGKLVFIDERMNTELFIRTLRSGLFSTLDMHGLTVGQVYLQMDNDPKHTAKDTKEWLARNSIECLQWPSCSQDMNPIEYVWNYVNQKIRERKDQPSSFVKLRQMLEEEWYAVPATYIRSLYESMPRRIEALRKAKGSHTKY